MQPDFTLFIVIWIAIVVVIAIHSWRSPNKTIGGMLTYVIFLSATYFLQPLLYTFPEYKPEHDPWIVYAGFQQSLLGLAGFAVGALIVVPVLRELRYSPMVSPATETSNSEAFPGLPLFVVYMIIGLTSYFIFDPLLSNIPTISAFFSGLSKLLHIGILIGLWTSAQKNKSKMIYLLLAITFVWPLVTVTTQGFLGFGLWPTVLIGIFVFLHVRRSKRGLIAALLVVYFAVSLTGTYFATRLDIRKSVWGGNGFNDRIDNVYHNLITNFQWVDFNRPQLLTWIDARLGLSYLTGAAIQRVDSGTVPFANGQTIADAAEMLIPRALWPDKSLTVGGNTLASYYSGRDFASGTSVGMGQTMEFYVNFGSVDVFVGFMIIGIVVAILDQKAATALREHRFLEFTLWIAPIFGLLLTEDNLLTVVATIGSLVLSLIVINLIITVYVYPSRGRGRLLKAP